MTQVGELVVFMKENDEKNKCEYDPKDKNKPWEANLVAVRAEREPKFIPAALVLNMKAGYQKDKKENSRWKKPDSTKSEKKLSETKWPSQAHHLIPNEMFEKHFVARWLKEGAYLFSDTCYNVDHPNNGKWLPYASSLFEWKSKTEIESDGNLEDKEILKNGGGVVFVEVNKQLAFKVMRESKKQLHQGSHSSSDRFEIGVVPYNKRVTQYLDKIEDNAISHYVDESESPNCEFCKNKKQSEKYPPRNNTVEYVDKASELIDKDINYCRIFVSKIAAQFAKEEGFSLEENKV